MPISQHHEPEYLSSATLIVLGTHLDPKEASTLLRMRPSDSWVRGDPKVIQGKVIGSNAHKWGGWKKSLPPSQMSKSLERQLGYWVRILGSTADGLVRLAALGNLCVLNCYLGTSGTATIALSPELQVAVGRLGLRLELDVFATA